MKKTINAIKFYDVKEIQCAEYNPRAITDQELQGLRNSIKKFGFIDPLIVNTRTNTLVGGHQRLKAAKLEGFKSVPAVEIDVSPSEEKALNVALNSHSIQGSFDLDKLSDVIADIRIELPELHSELNFDVMLDDLGVELAMPEDADFPDLASGDKPDIEQITFTLTSYQAENVRAALKKCISENTLDNSENKNKNGNAIDFICRNYSEG